MLTAAIATIPIVILQERGSPESWIPLADWAVWLVFVAALGIETYYAENPRRHLRRHPIDLAVVILSFPMLPTLLALTRLIRVVRVLRVVIVAARSVPALKATIGRRELLHVFSISLILVITAAVALVLLEPNSVGNSLAAALWWSFVTVTTVGYGDIAPVTTLGRVIAVLVMFAGLGVISTLSASIAAYFVDQGSQADMRQIDERLRRIETILQRIEGRQETPTRR